MKRGSGCQMKIIKVSHARSKLSFVRKGGAVVVKSILIGKRAREHKLRQYVVVKYQDEKPKALVSEAGMSGFYSGLEWEIKILAYDKAHAIRTVKALQEGDGRIDVRKCRYEGKQVVGVRHIGRRPRQSGSHPCKVQHFPGTCIGAYYTVNGSYYNEHFRVRTKGGKVLSFNTVISVKEYMEYALGGRDKSLFSLAGISGKKKIAIYPFRIIGTWHRGYDEGILRGSGNIKFKRATVIESGDTFDISITRQLSV